MDSGHPRIQDSVEEWLTKWLNWSIGIDQLIYEALLARFFQAQLSSGSTIRESQRRRYSGRSSNMADSAGRKRGSTSGIVTLAKVSIGVLQPNVTFNSGEMVVTFDFAS